MKNIDLAIIGGGIAGASAAVYAKRSGLDFIIFESKGVGGQLFFMETVDNYIGTAMGTKGRDLAAQLEKTMRELGINTAAEEISGISLSEKKIILRSDAGEYTARGAIIATGASFKKLGAPREEEFTGKGVSYCAICDGFFFKNKDVAVVGGGNTALEEALYLANICRRVYLVHRRDSLRAMDYLQKEISLKTNIEIIYNSVIKELRGKELLQNIVLEDVKTGQSRACDISGLFIAIGVKPNTEIFQGCVKLDEGGFILTNEDLATSQPFIWACGDCRRRPLRQLITAAAEGAITALSAYKYLKNSYVSA